MMLFISVLQGDSLLPSPMQTATLGVTAVLLLLLLRTHRGRIGATSVSPETLAWIHDLKIRPTVPESTRGCLQSLDWIQRLRIGRTAFRSGASTPVVEPAPVLEAEPVVEQGDEPHDTDEPGAAPPQDDVRVLRLHVKSLEAALDEHIDRVHELGELLAAAPRPAQDLDAVLATIHGLRTSMAADPAALRVLDRVEAGVCRLGAPADFTRPILPSRPSAASAPGGASAVPATPVELSPTIELSPTVELAVADELPAYELPAQEPAEEPSLPASTDDVACDVTVELSPAPVLPVPDHLVQPVPAPEPAPAAGTGRRWLRRLAA